MRCSKFAVLLTLVLLSISGLTLSAFATVSHPVNPRRRARHLQAVASSHHSSSLRTRQARAERVPARYRTRRGARSAHGAALIAAHRHAAPVAPVKAEV